MLFSYGVFVPNVNSIGIGGIEEGFLETKNLSFDDLDGLDDDAKNELESEYDDFVLERLKEQLEEYSECMGIQDGLRKARTESFVGFLLKAECSLPAFDHIFRRISEETLLLSVYDFSCMLNQGYEGGDHDTGSLSLDLESNIVWINQLLEQLAAQDLIPEKTDLDDVPIWRIFGECLLRCKNDLLPVDGIEVEFDGYGCDEDGNEGYSDIETYCVYIRLDEGAPSFYGSLDDCQTLPRVDWPYIQDKYESDLEHQLQNSNCGMEPGDFESHVRELFKRSLTSHLRDSVQMEDHSECDMHQDAHDSCDMVDAGVYVVARVLYIDPDESNPLDILIEKCFEFRDRALEHLGSSCRIFLHSLELHNGDVVRFSKVEISEGEQAGQDEIREICSRIPTTEIAAECESLDFSVITDTEDPWNNCFFEMSEPLGMLIVYGRHPHHAGIVVQGYEDGEFDTGIISPSSDDELDSYVVDLDDHRLLSESDFDLESYGISTPTSSNEKSQSITYFRGDIARIPDNWSIEDNEGWVGFGLPPLDDEEMCSRIGFACYVSPDGFRWEVGAEPQSGSATSIKQGGDDLIEHIADITKAYTQDTLDDLRKLINGYARGGRVLHEIPSRYLEREHWSCWVGTDDSIDLSDDERLKHVPGGCVVEIYPDCQIPAEVADQGIDEIELYYQSERHEDRHFFGFRFNDSSLPRENNDEGASTGNDAEIIEGNEDDKETNLDDSATDNSIAPHDNDASSSSSVLTGDDKWASPLANICRVVKVEFIDSGLEESIFVQPQIPVKKLNSALPVIDEYELEWKPKAQDVRLFIDDTILGSGKDFLLMTDHVMFATQNGGFYVMKYDDIGNVEYKTSMFVNGEIVINGSGFFIASQLKKTSVKRLVDLIADMWRSVN